MKKIVLFIIILVFVLSCVKSNNQLNVKYYDYIKELKNINESSEKFPFNIEIQTEDLNKNLKMYELTIDKSTEELKDFEVLITHNVNTKDIFPSIGIFESKLTLSDKTDKKNFITKGIILIGYIEEKITSEIVFKVLIKYKDKNQKEYKKFYIKHI